MKRDPIPHSSGGPDRVPEGGVVVFNRQRVRGINTGAVRDLALAVAGRLAVDLELGIQLVSAREMARINRQFLGHEGSTDVITFDQGSTPSRLKGELFISITDAVRQAAEFRTRWPDELARYIIHGLLHLKGYDDLDPASRRVMKQQEERWLRLESKQRRRLDRPARGRRGSPAGS